MLRDSAHIQESDAQWQNQKGKRPGQEPVEPLYTVHDAEEAVKRIVTCEYGTTLQIADGREGALRGRRAPAGLGQRGDAAHRGGRHPQGGLFRRHRQPCISPSSATPSYIRDADYVLTESTYGDRLHDMDKDPDYTADLAAIIDETLGNGRQRDRSPPSPWAAPRSCCTSSGR